MQIVLRFLVAPLLMVVGVVIMKYSVHIADFFGKADWAERYLPAGSYTMYKLIGLGFCIIGLLWMLGVFTPSVAVPVQNPENEYSQSQ